MKGISSRNIVIITIKLYILNAKMSNEISESANLVLKSRQLFVAFRALAHIMVQ